MSVFINTTVRTSHIMMKMFIFGGRLIAENSKQSEMHIHVSSSYSVTVQRCCLSHTSCIVLYWCHVYCLYFITTLSQQLWHTTTGHCLHTISFLYIIAGFESNQDSSVSIVPKVWATGFRTRGSIPGNGSICFSSPKHPEWLLGSPTPYSVVTGMPNPDGEGDKAKHTSM
jgi:hypothetical protein